MKNADATFPRKPIHSERDWTKQRRCHHRQPPPVRCATTHHEKYTEKRILAVKVTRNSIEATSAT